MSRNRHGKHDSRHYFEWMEFASEDLAAAALLMRDATCINAALFHCQQAIEKAAKAYLLFVTGRSYDGHNLSWLVRQASKTDAEFLKYLPDMIKLNRCYIECRYPSDCPSDMDISLLNELFLTTRNIYEYTCSIIYNEDYHADYDDPNEPD